MGAGAPPPRPLSVADRTAILKPVPAAATPIALIADKDERQALRIRRYVLAASTSLMVIALLYVAYLLGGLSWRKIANSACAPGWTTT